MSIASDYAKRVEYINKESYTFGKEGYEPIALINKDGNLGVPYAKIPAEMALEFAAWIIKMFGEK